ncbi:S-layer homology domain-containing protein [Paenibacillus sp. VCA1]|uniref:S-layer homology domain-containing protein n=1 Tax=Paenibacillus sp. VCA1 TaxID=3039148 RepID=UPI0028720B14|nr:S-layer homology domain-containing protein [Paenibacillus sp. VCA1]MDR9856905.1 S-layer homology domain-containing protein [Paenibacillus sp. VCA1]
MRGKPGKWPLIIILALFIQTSLGNGGSSPIFAASSNQAPVLKTSSGSASFIAGDNTTSTPVIIDTGLTLSDPDNTTLSSATVAITGNPHPGEDILAFAGNNAALYGNIKASYDSGSGVLTLTSSGATATVAQWQSALRSVTYTNTAITPNTATRTISFSVNDGTSVSDSATKTVTVTAVDQTPVLTTSDGPTVFKVEAGGTRTPVIVDSGLTVSDRDNSTLSSAIVAVTANYQPGDDMLTFIDTNTSQYGNIIASYNLSTGVLTLTSAGATATVAQWQNALRSVTYSNSKNAPNTSVRTISFSINDRIKTSDATTKTIIVTPANQAPVFVSTSSGETNFTTGDNGHGKSVVIDPEIKITAAGGTALASGTVAITDHFQSAEDVLAFSNVSTAVYGDISGSYDATTGVLALTSPGAAATVEQWQNALRSVTYANTNSTPNKATRVISFTLNDGKANSNTAAKNVTITVENQKPIVTTSGGTTTFTTSGSGTATPVAVDPEVTVSDPDNQTLASGTVAITDHFQSAEDVLAFSNVSTAVYGDITGSYDGRTGVLELTSPGAVATVEQWQNALRSVTYANTNSTPNTAERVISFTVNDGKSDSNTATKNVALEALQLTSLSANPATVTVQAGQSTGTVITATYSDQSQLDVTPYVSWTVQKPEVASVSGGTITGLSPGSTVLTAVYGTQSVDISLTVTSIPGHGGDSGGNNSGNNGGNDVSGGGGGGGGNSNPSPAVPNPVTPPVQKASAFYPFVDLDRLAAFIKAALASGNAPDFKDAASHWAAGDIRLAAKLGIAKGYQDGTFRPNAAITRAEFSTLLVKAFALRQGGETKTFGDVQSSWARESVEIIASLGVIGGYPDGTFRPDRPMTRAEMVAMISKLIVLQEDVSGKRGPFIDVAPQHWAGKLIEEAAAAGIIQGKTRDAFAPNDNVTRAEGITVILRMLRTEPTLKDLLK